MSKRAEPVDWANTTPSAARLRTGILRWGAANSGLSDPLKIACIIIVSEKLTRDLFRGLRNPNLADDVVYPPHE